MKAGASDYVMKDDLPRLAPAITRELRAAQDRKIRRQAQLAMAHLASIVETCDDAIISQTEAASRIVPDRRHHAEGLCRRITGHRDSVTGGTGRRRS